MKFAPASVWRHLPANPYAAPASAIRDIEPTKSATAAILLGAAIGNGAAYAALGLCGLVFLWLLTLQGAKPQESVHTCLPIHLVFGVRSPHWLNLPRAGGLLGSASQLPKASRQRLVRGFPGCGICDDPEFDPLRPSDSLLVTHCFYCDSDPRIPDWRTLVATKQTVVIDPCGSRVLIQGHYRCDRLLAANSGQ